MHIDLTLESPIHESFRVAQVAGMFDLSLAKTSVEKFAVDLPDLVEEWSIGAIVGPSGSGKTSIARKAYGDLFQQENDAQWPRDCAVIDGFGEWSIKEITGVLSSVGFSSPPSWVKPFHVLSNGEKFRCELARALLADRPLVIFDEFTSVVDRTVAKIGSAAVAKAIRKGRIKKRFVAVSCHYDILQWLEPDWVLDMASGQLARGSLRRPEIRIDIAPVHRSAWNLFRRHHYLNTSLLRGAYCFVAFWGETPVAFSAWTVPQTRSIRRGDIREHRTVVLPDYQGIGIGNKMSEFCASIFAGTGGRAFSTTSHPSMIGYRCNSPLWHCRRITMCTPPGPKGRFGKRLLAGKLDPKTSLSINRITAGFRYVGPPLDAKLAKGMLKFYEQFILQAVREHPGGSIRFLAAKTNLSTTCVSVYLKNLLDAGKINREGSGGSGPRQFCYYPANET